MVRVWSGLFGLVLAAVAGCSSSVEEVGIHVTASVAQPVGSAPDSVVFEVTFVNLGEESVTFGRGGPEVSLDVEVRGPEGEVVWRHLPEVVGWPARPYTVPASATDTWRVTWPVVDDQGVRVPAGEYVMVGLLGDDLDVPVRETVPHAVTVHR